VFVRYGEKLKYFDPETVKHFRILMEDKLVNKIAKKFGDVIDFIEHKDFVFLIFEHCEIIRKKKSPKATIEFTTLYDRFLPRIEDYANVTVKVIENELVLFYNKGITWARLDELISGIPEVTTCESFPFFKDLYAGKDFIPILKESPFGGHAVMGIISIKEPSPEAKYRGVSICGFGGPITYVDLSIEKRFIIAVREGYDKRKVIVHENCDPNDPEAPRIEIIRCSSGIDLELYNFEYVVRVTNLPSYQRFMELRWSDLTEYEIWAME
jgi:hypothetical protein